MFLAGRDISAKWVRLVCLVVCFAVVLSSLPVYFKRDSAVAQSSGDASLKRQRPPYYNLPNLDDLLTEGENLQRPTLPHPPLKPSTTCGYRDEACKRKKEKEKKVSRNITPSKDKTGQESADVARKSDRNWLGRLGRAFSSALSGFASASAKGNSFLASDLNRNAGNSALGAFTNTAVSTSPAMPPPTFNSYLEAKLDPRYRVGGTGEDLFSGNYNFSLPVVSLPGRAGLDLNLTVSYNSLVWIRWSNIMSFDYDYYPTLTPGFRIGFPEIQGPYYLGSVKTYLVYLPSGRRVEMREVETNKFEAIDSSYLYLIVNGVDQTQMTLYSTDGTQYKFERPFGGNSDSRCTQIKDGNGNYISIIYKNVGAPEYPLTVIDKVIDTLGREIVFEYDGALHLLKVKQNWNGQEYIWAQFEYGTKYVTPNFGSLYVDGPNNTDIPTITRIVTGDGARYTFVYNSWGQVEDLWTHGEADNQRAGMDYVFPSTSSPQSDCPRFTQRNDYIANWAGETGNGWAINYFSLDPNETYGQVTGPDGVTYKEIFSTSGGTRGLITRTETRHGGAIQQFTDLTWTSDSATSPPLRPRVTETKICDDRNHNGTYQSGTDKLRKTTIEYTTVASTVRLPRIIREYNEGGGSVYRSVKTDYVTDANYLSRRIIGLPSFTYLYEGDQATLKAQKEYIYDSLNEEGTTFLQGHPSAPRQHDATNYGTGFRYRGNLTKARRYSVVGGVAGSPIENKTGYFITGAPALAKDALNHQTSIYYDDSFSGGVAPSPPTYAYPTKVTDPDGFSSASKYSYDFGGVTETIDPKSYAASPTNPPVNVVRTYDARGRLDKLATWKDGAEYSHTRYNYGLDHNSVQTWTTVNSLSEETAVLHLLDGIGRERIVVNEHPGSQGGLSAFYRLFDKAGRVEEWSRPTEIHNVTWAAVGDDTGYVVSRQIYDWKGRPLITTNPDNTTRQIEYVGCGCAGGDIVIARGERVTDSNGNQNRRTTKTWRDVFGRTEKVQILNWGATSDTDGTAYSTSLYIYDIRDQIIQTSQTAESSGVTQITTSQYDGYGRLWKFKRPEDSSDAVYEYNSDHTLWRVTDPRGANSTFSYNGRDLVIGVAYAGAASTPGLSFNYDPAGNRTQMTDGAGSLNYQYNALSRLESETRTFVNPQTSAVIGNYTLNYEYNLAGQLKKIASQGAGSAAAFNYNLDKAGRITGLSADGPFLGTSQYLSNIQYRAWGSVKHTAFGNGYAASAKFNPRMQISEYDAPNVFKLGYEYSADGRLQNVLGMSDVKLDRKVTHDHVGRLAAILTANDTQLHSTSEYLQADSTVPLKRTYSNDAFDNFSFSRERDWNTYESDYSASYSNNRAASLIRTVNSQTTTTTQGFDSAGEVITTGTQQYLRDALGRVISEGLDYPNATTFYDGDGQLAKDKNGYYLRSSVLGGKVVEKISNAGQRKERLIYVGGALIATQTLDDPNITNDFEVLTWQIRDPHHTAERNASIKTGDTQYSIYSAYVFDGLGNGVGAVTGTQMAQFWSGQSGANYWNSLSGADFYAKGRDAGAPSYTAYRPLGGADCRMDGVTANCDDVLRALSNGSADLIHLSTPNPFLGIGMVSLTSRFYRSQTDVKIPGAIDKSGGARGGNDGSFVEWDWVGREEQQAPNIIPDKQPKDFVEPPPNPDCDATLTQIFGGKGSVAAGSGYDPEAVEKQRNHLVTGQFKWHLYRYMHLYATADGKQSQSPVGIYIPYDGAKIPKVTRFDYPLDEAGATYKAHYNRLGNLKNVTLYIYHVGNFKVRAEEGRIRIGDIGGPNVDRDPNYSHSHLSIKGKKGAYTFVETFCK